MNDLPDQTVPTGDAGPYRSSRTRGSGRGLLFQLLCELGGVRMAAILIGLVGLVIALATVYERDYGREVAAVMIYQAWWFGALFILLGACIAAAVIIRLPLQRRQWGFAVVHLGLLLLIAGFLAAAHRLDGSLEAAPGRPASRIDLPTDALVVLDGAQQHTVAFQPIACAGYPSLLRFAFLDMWGPAMPGLQRLSRPLQLLDVPGLRAELTAVLDAGGPELGFTARPGGRPAVLLTLMARTPASPALETAARSWLHQGETLFDQGLVVGSLMLADSPFAADGFLAPTEPAGADGELVVALADRSVRVPLDSAHLGQAVDLGPDLALRPERIIANPRQSGDDLVQDDAAQLDPLITYSIGRGAPDQRTWTRRFASAYILSPAGDGLPEVRYEHRALHRAVGGQGSYVQLLSIPSPQGRRLLVRWFTRSKGYGGGDEVKRDWQGDLVGSAQGPMQIRLGIDWLPAAIQSPEAVEMQPGRQDRASRWIQVHFSDGAGNDATRWMQRDQFLPLDVGDHHLQLSYRRDVYDLQARNGFAVRLDRFDEGKDPGGMRSASYQSDVTILPPGAKPADAGDRATITMNEPLHRSGITVYQAAFRPEVGQDGRPTGRKVSIFTVATDPGRELKYAGSAVLVGGILLMYLMRRRPARAKATP